MGGDLNLKKSWHPVLMKNQRRVYEEEMKAIEERKKILQIQKERAEERQIQELQRMQEVSGGNNQLNRVDWMYNGPANGQSGTAEEMESYLLGKRRVDTIVASSDVTANDTANASTEDLVFTPTAKDIASKLRDDPLFSIKKREQADLEAMIHDPNLRLKLLQQQGIAAQEQQAHSHSGSIRREHQHRHHHRTHYGSPLRRRRSSSPSSGDDKHTAPYRTRSPRRQSRRYRSPYRRSHSHSYDYNSGSRDRDRDRNPNRERDHERDYRHRSSPLQELDSAGERRGMKKSRASYRRRIDYAPSSPPRCSSWDADNTAAERLAAMQKAAHKLDKDRETRLAEMKVRDKAEQDANEASRMQLANYGGKSDFVMGMTRKAGELALGERIRRRVGGGFDKEESF